MGLKPCPFCGGRADPPKFYGNSRTARFIACETCGANIYRAQPGENDAVLMEAWNARTAESGAYERGRADEAFKHHR